MKPKYNSIKSILIATMLFTFLGIFNSCQNLIRELQSLPLSKTNSEDVDTKASDHAYDALRYMLMSRPRLDHPYDRMLKIKTDIYQPADSTFGY